MKTYCCPKCGSVDLFVKSSGNQRGLYCGDCGAWIKWLGKNEEMLVERFIESQKNECPMSAIVQQMSPKEFAIKMTAIAQTSRDDEQSHIDMDNIICELLESLGYGEGVEVFRDAPKWYS